MSRELTSTDSRTLGRESLREGFEGHAFVEQTSCPICGNQSKLFAKPKVLNSKFPIPYDLLRCRVCGHGWLNPLLTQDFLSYLYANSSHSVIGVGWDREEKTKLTYPERQVLQRERESTGDYFELGVGKGLLFRQFLDLGWNCCGIEPGYWGRLPNVLTSIEELAEDRTFDVIVALDVLEHVSDPLAMLKRLRRAAKPHSRLYCAFPNIQSLRAWVCGPNWRMAKPLTHVHYFSAGSVRGMLNEAGFELTQAVRTDLWEWCPIPRTWPFAFVEYLGLGDQWFISARPTE